MKIGIQMDPIQTVDPFGDSSFALAEHAFSKNFEIHIFQTEDVYLYVNDKNNLFANTRKIEHIKMQASGFVTLGEKVKTNLSDLDLILIRQDPPFDINYITSCFLLESIKDKVLLLNNPAMLRNCPEKIWVTNFKHFMPETIITKNFEKMLDFLHEQKEIIVKPLHGNGGAGIFLLHENDPNIQSLFELLQAEKEYFIGQKFIKNVSKGDKRIIFFDGEVKGFINRVPKQNSIRSNLHVGGSAEKTSLTKKEFEICEELSPHLKKNDLFFVGIDVIDDYLTEINITSPTGLRSIDKLYGKNLCKDFWEMLLAKYF